MCYREPIVDKTLLDLGAIINLLSYSIYIMQLGLVESKLTFIILQLVDRLAKILCDIIEDVLIQTDKFYFPVNFKIIDTQPVQYPRKCTPIILVVTLLDAVDAHISCKARNMQLSFGNMNIKLNIFNVPG